MQGKIYFGHPINTYNTDLEAGLLRRINKKFPQYEIENPNQPHHIKNYLKLKAETGNGMPYFLEKVLPKMSAGIFLAFKDGMLGAGIFQEAKFLSCQGKPIYEINFEGRITGMQLGNSRALSIEETRKRTQEKY